MVPSWQISPNCSHTDCSLFRVWLTCCIISCKHVFPLEMFFSAYSPTRIQFRAVSKVLNCSRASVETGDKSLTLFGVWVHVYLQRVLNSPMHSQSSWANIAALNVCTVLYAEIWHWRYYRNGPFLLSSLVPLSLISTFASFSRLKSRRKPDGVSRNSWSLFTKCVATLSSCVWINTSCVKYKIYKSKRKLRLRLNVFVCIWKFMKFSFCSKGKRYSIFFYTRCTSASLRAGCLKCGDGLGYLLIQYLTFPRGKMANINNSKLL